VPVEVILGSLAGGMEIKDIAKDYDIKKEDVRDIGMRAAKDREIMDYAFKNNKIIITRDLDFGEVLRYPQHPRAIILRLPYAFTSKEINERLGEFFVSIKEKDLIGAITIVELSRYRRRSLRND
jgi:predicted nuclease of predicted toxin-antitoxin system